VGTRLPASVPTSHGAQPVSCTGGTGSFTGVKKPERAVNHPPHTALRLKKEYSPLDLPLPAVGLTSSAVSQIKQNLTLSSHLISKECRILGCMMRPVAGFYQHSDEHSGSINGDDLLQQRLSAS